MTVRRWSAALIFVGFMVPVAVQGEGSESTTREQARSAIEAGNIAWGQARVAIDTVAFERMLAPDLYVQLSSGQRLTRKQFIDEISNYAQGVSLTKFDASVLLIEPKGSDWTAIILEKLEFKIKAPDGKTETRHATWVTRDGWRKVGGNRWLILFSEEVGHE